MASGADATRENWQALRRLALLCLADLRRQNPEWSLGDLKRHLSLPDTGLFQELTEEAGFEPPDALPAGEQNRVLRVMLRGVFSPREIARETKLPLPRVKEILDKAGVPYAAGGWGMFTWPGTQEAEEGSATAATPRRVSKKGQFSYKGRKYGLGSACSTGICWVEEAGKSLIVRLPGRSSVTLSRKTCG